MKTLFFSMAFLLLTPLDGASADPVFAGKFVCGGPDILPRSKKLATQTRYLLDGIPSGPEFMRLMHLERPADSRAEIQAAFKNASLVRIVDGKPVGVPLSPPDKIEFVMDQTFGECLVEGPRTFGCGSSNQHLPRVCCEGAFKTYSLSIQWAQMELEYRVSSGSILHPAGRRKANEILYCPISERVPARRAQRIDK